MTADHLPRQDMLDPTWLPVRDHRRAAMTGLTREHWDAVAERLLLALRSYASDDGSRFLLPGRPSSSGSESDAFEGFARSFLLMALLLAGRRGEDPNGHASRYAAGLAAGVDPDSPTAWPRPGSVPQARVEAASIALGLDLTREWIWERLDAATQSQVRDWLREVVGVEYPPINWVWFRIIVLTFLRDVDPRVDPARGADADVEAFRGDLARDLAVHESCAREGGWFSDGPERAYDHYGTWAFAVFPTLWMRMRGISALRADGVIDEDDAHRHRERLAAFLPDALGLVGADGGPLIQGRSLVYRMAAAATPWAAALGGLAEGTEPLVSPGRLRRAASGILDHFLRHGVPDDEGLLSLGWFDAFPQMAQSYSGPGSPYWAVKGFLGLVLPADHPVWTEAEEPLPVEEETRVEVLPAPGWIVSRTCGDGIVRVINHGTDHALPADLREDSPLYARLGYSTVSSPPMAGPGTTDPRDGTVAIIHPEHGWSHRTGFEALELRQVEDRTAVAISRQRCHWVLPQEAEGRDHGEGRSGAVIEGAELTIASIVRDGIELRIVRPSVDLELSLGIAGWPLSGSGEIDRTGASQVRLRREDGSSLFSTISPLRGRFEPAVHREQAVSPLGPSFAVPQLELAGLRAEERCAVTIHLGAVEPVEPQPMLEMTPDAVTVRWDGVTIDVPLGGR